MKNKVYLIAEIGVNHNGSIQKAKKLIKNLAVLDIDAIKIQAFSAKNIASKNAELAGYQKRNISNSMKSWILTLIILTKSKIMPAKI